MKKIISCLVLILVCCCISVKAETYSTGVIIPVDTVATVSTDLFLYQDFSYNSVLDANGEATINFAQISNRTSDKVPVSINILLFDINENNIGYLTYCTDRDWDSDNNKLKLNGNQSIPFSIKVTSRYFAFKDEDKKEKYGAGDVKYIAVLDDNQYCKVGGYDNYVGKTLDQIIGNSSNNSTTTTKSVLTKYSSIIKIIAIAVVGATFIGVIIFILKFIMERMPSKSLSTKKTTTDSKVENQSNNYTNNNSASSGNDVIDLSYHGDVSLDDDEFISAGANTNTTNNNINDLFNISAADSGSNEKDNDNTSGVKSDSENQQENGESDLSKFFK